MRWLPVICAGVALALGEAGWLLARGYHLFFSASERLLVVAAQTVLVCAVVAFAWLLAPALAADANAARARKVWLGGAGFYALCTSLLLTDGRRVRDLAVRPLLVVAAAGAAAAGLSWLLRATSRARASSATAARVYAACLLASAFVALSVDARVLARGYPAFHAGLMVFALLAAALAGLAWPTLDASSSRWPRPCFALAAALGAWALTRVVQHPNVGFIVREHGVFSQKLAALVPTSRVRDGESGAATAPPIPDASRGAAVDLRDRDILIVTVDALRADMLRAYGGHGLTPHMDALADEGVVFERAYTPAPHTSYALASLLTAKFVKPVAELSRDAHDHVTLPDLLRRYGYRTAAFYPPAIFFVDGARFAPLHRRAFGFEYLKEMYASAELRVAQLSEYLEHAEPGHPVFVWVHLFEPHEPYEPPAGWPRTDSARGRYEGEVVEADRAFGQLVALFRAKKPRATVILAADHGEEFGEHGGSFHGTTLYDEQARIPLVWSSPQAVQARVSAAPVELVDVGSTLLATAGIPRDPRMRGDDLSGALAGDDTRAPRFAFASVEDRTMITDGRLKAVCAAGEPHCQLFDLAEDPGETRSLTAVREADAQRLRRELDGFLRSVPEVEALSVDDGVAFPEALARAELGVVEALPQVAAFLADARAAVRAKAARLLGEHGQVSASEALVRLAEQDADADVQREAAIAALALGQLSALPKVRATLTEPGERATRAALVLGRHGDTSAVVVLAELAADKGESESARAAAVDVLARIHNREARDALIAVLDEPRLGARAADGLREGQFLDAVDALARSLEHQRYPAVRAAQARALFAFGDARAQPLTLRFLGMESSLPGGLALLQQHGYFTHGSGEGAAPTQPKFRRGAWRCDQRGCAPDADAALSLQARARGPQRLLIAVHTAPTGGTLQVGRHTFALHGGPEELNTLVEADELRGRAFPVMAAGGVTLGPVLLVDAEPEIPPPPPERWDPDAGVNDAPTREH